MPMVGNESAQAGLRRHPPRLLGAGAAAGVHPKPFVDDSH